MWGNLVPTPDLQIVENSQILLTPAPDLHFKMEGWYYYFSGLRFGYRYLFIYFFIDWSSSQLLFNWIVCVCVYIFTFPSWKMATNNILSPCKSVLFPQMLLTLPLSLQQFRLSSVCHASELAPSLATQALWQLELSSICYASQLKLSPATQALWQLKLSSICYASQLKLSSATQALWQLKLSSICYASQLKLSSATQALWQLELSSVCHAS